MTQHIFFSPEASLSCLNSHRGIQKAPQRKATAPSESTASMDFKVTDEKCE